MKLPQRIFATVLLSASFAIGHPDPDPILHWDFQGKFLKNGKLVAQRGPDLHFRIPPTVQDSGGIETVAVGGDQTPVALQNFVKPSPADLELPPRDFTISAWCSVDTPQEWGGIVGALQDNGGAEKGWVLGYNKTNFYVGLSTEGADDGNGAMLYLTGKTKYEPGRLYHVVSTYDGQQLRLFVNGKLDAESNEQSGKILYPSKAPLAVGGYLDENEDFPHEGRLRSVRVWDVAAKAQWVAGEFDHHKEWAAAEARFTPQTEQRQPIIEHPSGLKFVVHPYLQWATTSGMTVMAECSQPARGTVRWGETERCEQRVEGQPETLLHEIRIEGLEPDTQYFYRFEATADDGGVIRSPVLTFQTAPDPGKPFTFAIISDTQSNPQVVAKVASMAWAQRPHFLLLPGDLVSTGGNKSHWTEHFFPNMKPLIERVALFPVLGNHEENARHYYDYMSLPAPEYYYTFTYGNAQFFMIDSNKKLHPGSEQFEWLAKELEKSTATWKFAGHHHPAYSSDENDYGDLWKTNRSTRGDLNARHLTKLYDQFGVDIAWTGHIHSYERTWPVLGQRSVERGGTIYMVTGGGGGGLEQPGPFRPFFQNTVMRGHHYCMARLNGNRLEFFAYDIMGRLFDTLVIEKGNR